jgi:hypothetical protein
MSIKEYPSSVCHFLISSNHENTKTEKTKPLHEDGSAASLLFRAFAFRVFVMIFVLTMV